MAATDQTYRKQYTLDIVFAVSSVPMLVSIVLMFAQDYFRPLKLEQRAFRDVEVGVAQRMALAAMPTKAEFEAKENALKAVIAKRNEKGSDGKTTNENVKEIWSKLDELRPRKEKSDAEFQSVKQNWDSVQSLIYIETDDGKKNSYAKEFARLTGELAKTKAVSDDYDEKMKELQDQLSKLQAPLLEAESEWKKLNDKFEAQAKLAIAKQWTMWDSIRDLPVIDGFASPFKIHQFTIESNDIPLDYNLAIVRRYDRCMTCHLGIDRPAYTKEMLRSLVNDPTKEQEKELEIARKRLEARRKELQSINPKDANDLPWPSQTPCDQAFQGRADRFTHQGVYAHPRLELFVGSNSKHPAEKFGCTSCHRGQGAGTTFNGSFHSPNSSAEQEPVAQRARLRDRYAHVPVGFPDAADRIH